MPVRYPKGTKENSRVPLSEINLTLDAEAYALTITVLLVGIPILIDWIIR